MVKPEIDVHGAIMKTLNIIKEMPLIIHSEADLRALLYNELSKKDKPPYEDTSSSIIKGIKLKTNRIHCEYHKRDIVVFNRNHIGDIKLKGSLLWDDKKPGEILCDAIIELKVETGFRNNKKEVKRDFLILRKEYGHYFKKYKTGPALYFIFYVFCSKKGSFDKFLEELLEITQDGREINYYLLIGPKNQWEEFLKNNNLLEKYKKAKNVFLEFTL